MNPESSALTFASLPLLPAIQQALAAKGYTHPSPIQARAIPPLLEGRDMIGIAQTGTGKTAAFALPMLHRLVEKYSARSPRHPRALILTPTRELAVQIADNIERYGEKLDIRHALVFGGVGEYPQIRALAQGVDIVVATPGRLLDLMQQKHVSLSRVQMFVLDEADRMLDMGFAPSVKRIIATLPQQRQSLLFSATMPNSIRDLANSLLRDPVRVEVTPEASTAERVEQTLCHVAMANKHSLLLHHLKQHQEGLVLVFSRTKHGADRIVKNLDRDGVRANAIHGNKSQGARQRALESFRNGETRVLVATDIAARGIDVKGVSLVINYDLPDEPEAYVHRIGRTARAGAEGLAIAYCTPEDLSTLRDVQRTIRQQIPVDDTHPFAPAGGTPSLEGRLPVPPKRQPQQRGFGGGGRGGRQGGGGGRGFQGGGQGQGHARDSRGHGHERPAQAAGAGGHGGHAPRPAGQSAGAGHGAKPSPGRLSHRGPRPNNPFVR